MRLGAGRRIRDREREHRPRAAGMQQGPAGGARRDRDDERSAAAGADLRDAVGDVAPGPAVRGVPCIPGLAERAVADAQAVRQQLAAANSRYSDYSSVKSAVVDLDGTLAALDSALAAADPRAIRVGHSFMAGEKSGLVEQHSSAAISRFFSVGL